MMNSLINKVAKRYLRAWLARQDLADKTPGEMVRASNHHYFCELDVVVILEVPQRGFLQKCLWRIT